MTGSPKDTRPVKSAYESPNSPIASASKRASGRASMNQNTKTKMNGEILNCSSCPHDLITTATVAAASPAPAPTQTVQSSNASASSSNNSNSKPAASAPRSIYENGTNLPGSTASSAPNGAAGAGAGEVKKETLFSPQYLLHLGLFTFPTIC